MPAAALAPAYPPGHAAHDAMVEPINTVRDHLRGGAVDVAIFIEVALVVVVREIITLPAAETHPAWVDLGV